MLDRYSTNKWRNEVGSCLVLLCTLSSSHTGLSSALVPKLILTFSPFSFSSCSWKVPRVITGWTPACYSGFYSNITCSVRPSLTTPSNTTLPACRSYSLSCYSDLIFYYVYLCHYLVYMENFCLAPLNECSLSTRPYLLCLSQHPYSLEQFQAHSLCTDWTNKPTY